MHRILFVPIVCCMLGLLSCGKSTGLDQFPITHDVSDIRIMNADGTNDHPLTNDHQVISYANFLPNGSKIFYVQIIPYPQVVYSVNPDGTGKVAVFSKTIFPAGVPRSFDMARRIVFSPDSRKIIFSTPSSKESSYQYFYDIYSINTDGTNEVNLTQNNGKQLFHGFSVSNDSRRIVYSELGTDSINHNNISIIDADGKNRVIVKTFGNIQPLFPQFLPTDNNIVVYLESDDAQGFYLKRLSLSDPTAVTTIARVTRFLQFPSISNSNKMIFNGIDFPFSVITVDLLTGVKQSFLDPSLSWISLSNDGNLLVLGDMQKSFTIVNIDGSASRTINSTATKAENVAPFLSPSNQQLIYISISTEY